MGGYVKGRTGCPFYWHKQSWGWALADRDELQGGHIGRSLQWKIMGHRWPKPNTVITNTVRGVDMKLFSTMVKCIQPNFTLSDLFNMILK